MKSCLVLVLFFTIKLCSSQISVCDKLTVLSLEYNSTGQNGVAVEIFYDDFSSQKLSHVGISVLFDSNMDTIVASGGSTFMSLFGGNGTYFYTYPIQNFNPNVFEGFVEFVYLDTNSGLTKKCLLNYKSQKSGSVCEDLCVTNVYSDSTNELIVDVYYKDSSSQFLNYPRVLNVFDANMDTVATGQLNSFGQFGGDTASYYTYDSIYLSQFSNFSGFIEFGYSGNSGNVDTCLLPYPVVVDNGLCNKFCPTEIFFDSTGNYLNVTIFYDDSSSNWVSGPELLTVLDSNGDTISYGIPGFFGHTGGASQTYTSSPLVSSIPPNFEGEVIFTFQNPNTFVYDTCRLVYPCLSDPNTISESVNLIDNIIIYPNPFRDELNIRMDYEGVIVLRNSLGQVILEKDGLIGLNSLNVMQQPIGMYVLSIYSKNKIIKTNKVIKLN